MRSSVLGTLEARDEGGAVELSPKLRDLLAILLCVPDAAVRAERLVDGLWGTRRRALADGCVEHGAALLREAAALWRGAPYQGQEHLAAVRREAVRLGEPRLAATEARIDADLDLGRHADVVAELRCLVVDDPFRERPRARLMLALYHLGRAAEALEVYRETRALFAAELGLDVSPSLRALEKAILSHDAALARGLVLTPGRGAR